jgi:hypothetical protein
VWKQPIFKKVFVEHKVVHLGITPNFEEVWQLVNCSNLEENVVKVPDPKIYYIKEQKARG